MSSTRENMIQECGNPIVEDDFHGFSHRNCEGTEQLRKIGIIQKEGVSMEAFQHQLQGITLEQYERFPEDYRVEVFDGAVYHMSSPSQAHQTILTELLVSLRGYIKEKSGNCSVPSQLRCKNP